MSIRWILSACVVIAGCALIAAPGFSEDEPEQPAQPAAGEESPWAALAKRGPEHQWMNFMVGSWNAAGRFWMGPGEPTETTGTMEAYWIHDRRFVRSHYSGAWEGNAFRGEATMGFDNATQNFVTIWLDTMSTGISRTLGTREGDVVTLLGTSTIPGNTLCFDNVDIDPFFACPEDINGDGIVDVLDLLALLAAWGNPGGPEDVNGDGIVDVLDLLMVLAAWGPC